MEPSPVARSCGGSFCGAPEVSSTHRAAAWPRISIPARGCADKAQEADRGRHPSPGFGRTSNPHQQVKRP
jgi:hypothetical protein